MSAMPLISVIVPVYNVAPYLRQCLDTIINQTYTNIEIIILASTSTDNSVEICELGLFDLYTADEVIVSGTAAELCAIVKIDGRTIGAGVPGPVYKKLLADFQEETKIGDAY